MALAESTVFYTRRGRTDCARHVAGLLAASALLAGLLPLAAQAATRTGTFRPSVTIAAVCTITSAPIAFGNVPNLTTARTANATIGVRCNNGVPYALGLGPGLNSASTTTRKMKYALGAQTINYNIYSNAALTQNWGNVVGVDTLARTGNGAVQNRTARGRIPVQAVPHTGGFSDTVQIIVTY